MEEKKTTKTNTNGYIRPPIINPESNQVGSRMLIKTTDDKVEDCGMYDKIFMLDKQTYDKLVEAQNK